jgi:hypothetical protein
MDTGKLSVASEPAINYGVLFILLFALIVGIRPVRADDPGADDSVTQSETVSASGSPCWAGVCDVVL